MPLKILDLDYKYNNEKKDTNSLLNVLRHTLHFKGFLKNHSINVEKPSYTADGKQFPSKLNTELLHGLAIPFLVTYPRKMKLYSYTKS